MATGTSGTSQSRAESTWKYSPFQSTSSTGEQFADDLDRFAKHVLAPRDRRPSLTDDVFVEVLPTAEPEGEAPVGEDLQGRRLLGDNRRVVSHRRARHVGEQLDAHRWRGRPHPTSSMRWERDPARSATARSGRCTPRSRSRRARLKRHSGQALWDRSARSSGCSRTVSCWTNTRTYPT